MLNTPVSGKIQGLFKVFECFSSTFKGIFLKKTFQDSPVYSSTFQACVNPARAISDTSTGLQIRVHVVKIIFLISQPKHMCMVLCKLKLHKNCIFDYVKC